MQMPFTQVTGLEKSCVREDIHEFSICCVHILDFTHV